MRRALALARRGTGQTSPNPCVGAVVVRNGRVIGEGWHKVAGGPHAEVNALARTNARGATLYVTLEPCCTHGRTPPCTDAIIAAGIRRVVVAAIDPNPKHRGRGLRLLRQAGLRVDAGLLADEATALNTAFNKWIVIGKPLVIAKAALSLDGQMATRTGDSRWITSAAARGIAHRIRAQVDAIMVSAGTVVADDPRLTVRHGAGAGRQPWRVVVDTRGRSPLSARVFTDRHRNRTMVVTGLRSRTAWRETLAERGVTVILIRTKGSHVKMQTMLRELGRRAITSVLVEGGAGLLGALFDAGQVDRVAYFYAPKVIAGVSVVARATVIRGTWRRIGDGEIVFEGTVA